MIEHYFKQGFVYDKILQFLSKYHGINISMQTLNTKLPEFGLRRRNQEYILDDIRRCIQIGCTWELWWLSTYRSVWHTLQIEGHQVPRETFREVVKELDPDGVQARRAKTLRRRTYCNPGPNHSWHVDGYDKLKPYGFPVHGCIL